MRNINILVPGASAGSVAGTRMEARARRAGRYGESAWDTRLHILADRVPYDVPIRAFIVVPEVQDEQAVHAELETVLVALVAAAPSDSRRMLVH